MQGVSGLPALSVLNASHNKIASIAGIAGCTILRDLWIQNNQLKSLEELRPLSTLTSLQRMMIKPNPACKQLPEAQSRLVMISLCPGLQVSSWKAISSYFALEGVLISTFMMSGSEALVEHGHITSHA